MDSIPSQPYSWVLNQTLKNPTENALLFSRKISTFPQFPSSQTTQIPITPITHLPNASQQNPTKPIFSFSRFRYCFLFPPIIVVRTRTPGGSPKTSRAQNAISPTAHLQNNHFM
ncbi:hypothetical protein Pint_26186 [Pistacia integerrima]|uniref:Uncharacterized protein n=1 Tax=Pistacia integerrima TaxID=434235 RepID=A0ACC0YB70_9ROSI|nr:hypothetical protein Pint_26186 [Pistacia integerrima]